ncbi:hypothetical protein [Elstera cyanobacteriorum]|uniref:Flagellin N-terminal domain-containing protein n=1 Tax=Elstera cyanobacteriorum TaxID=2022747 RepID=A0A255XQU2_9PROT|nr:hypothetical protein [Elstera cyanobacteriorum]MCK6442087.1 hypothetical protein [Elstera cyanobacteriorum]OYQ18724.1 hypothetical protein CHR90_10725 [Elstera cyanobacteriorum]GFZ78146.1 hypothetical protein GCM10011497_02690 [Elstera cyanobacteriorum]
MSADIVQVNFKLKRIVANDNIDPNRVKKVNLSATIARLRASAAASAASTQAMRQGAARLREASARMEEETRNLASSLNNLSNSLSALPVSQIFNQLQAIRELSAEG